MRYKALYVVLGIFSPEIVLAIAFNEWRDARRVVRQWEKSAAISILKKEVDSALKYLMEEETGEGDELGTEGTRGPLLNLEEAIQHAKDVIIDGVKVVDRGVSPGGVAAGDDYLPPQGAAVSDDHLPPQGAAASEESLAPETAEADGDNVASEVDCGDEHNVGPVKIKVDEKDVAPKGGTLSAFTELRASLRRYKALKRVLKAQRKSRVRGFVRRWVEGFRATRVATFFSDMFEEHEFGMESGFFAVMGGYTFCPVDKYMYSDPELERTLSPDGLIYLLEKGAIDPYRLASLKGEIVDKGKADMLAKMLVCAQAMWMMIDCICRKIAGLPVTIIEINVIVHVLCAVAVYVCWWKKPHNVGRALSLTPGVLSEPMSSAVFVADMPYGCKVKFSRGLTGSRIPTSTTMAPQITITSPEPPEYEIEDNSHSGGFLPHLDTSHRYQTIPLEPSDSFNLVDDNRSRYPNQQGTSFDIPLNAVPPVCTQVLYRYTRDELSLAGVSHKKVTLEQLPMPRTGPGLPKDRHLELIPGRMLVFSEDGFLVDLESAQEGGPKGKRFLTDSDLLIFKKVAEMVRGGECEKLIRRSASEIYSLDLARPEEGMSSQPSRIPTDKIARVLIPLCLIYGGIHASLWNSYFPSHVESLLWRISCILVAIPGPGVLAIKAAKRLSTPGEFWKRLPPMERHEFGTYLLVLATWLLVSSVSGALIYFAIQANNHFSEPQYVGLLALIYIFVIMVILSCAGSAAAISLFAFVQYTEWVCMPLTIAYCAARVYIFLESFLCLRSLPYGAFKTVIWADVWPHL